MNELKSYTEYAVSTPTADFVIGFDFNYGEDAVNVTVDDVPATTAGYTVVYLNETTIRLSPSVPSGVVRLQRETDIDQTDHAYRAGAKFIAQTMDENFEQLRHSQQEVRDGFVKLADDTYEIIDTLEEVAKSAQDAADDANAAAQVANAAAALVADKVSQSELSSALQPITQDLTTVKRYTPLPYIVKNYEVGERVTLSTGEVVENLVLNNNVNPNTNLIGWAKVNSTSRVYDASGETQQQVNYNGGSKWYSRVGGYLKNERVVLTNGDIVKSTVDGNTNDPNVDMLGWSNETEELYVFRQPVIYAKNIKTDGTDQLALLNAYAAEAVAKKMTLVLPSGVISIADEFIPPNHLTMRGVVDNVTNAGSVTVLKWIGANGTNKAVLRCSRKPIGLTPAANGSEGVNCVKIDIVIDATGCDYGAYFRFFTEDSSSSIVVRNADKCGIMILQCWFSEFPKLIALGNKGVGISVGLPLSGETGDTAVNAINFGYIRAHSNGRDLGYSDTTENIRKGCGLMIRSRSCSYTSIQSELNYGVGMIEDSYLRNNFYGAIYLEANCRTSSTEDIGLLNYGSHTFIQNLYLAVNAKVRNAVSDILHIQNSTKDGDEQGISLSSVGKIAYYGNNYNLLGYLPASDYARLVYSDVRVIKDIGVANIKYSSDKPFPTTDFYVFSRSSVRAVFVPKVSATMTKKAIFYIDDVYVELDIVNPVAGVPVSIRFPSFLAKGKHTFRLGDAATSANFECGCYLVCGVLPSGSAAESFEM